MRFGSPMGEGGFWLSAASISGGNLVPSSVNASWKPWWCLPVSGMLLCWSIRMRFSSSGRGLRACARAVVVADMLRKAGAIIIVKSQLGLCLPEWQFPASSTPGRWIREHLRSGDWDSWILRPGHCMPNVPRGLVERRLLKFMEWGSGGGEGPLSPGLFGRVDPCPVGY